MSEATWGGSDEPTVTIAPAVDPWPDAPLEPTLIDIPQAAPVRPGRRAVYGRVYELRLAGQRDDDHEYVGKTTTTIHRRVFGPSASAHASPQSVAKDPWKARILPGRAGYRQLEVVYCTGLGEAADRAALARAEAFWIDRLKAQRNDVRPVRPFADQPQPARRAAIKRPARRKRRPVPWRAVWWLALVALFTYVAARVVVAMDLPWPAAPWIAAPTVGVLVGWSAFWKLHRSYRKLTGRRR